MKKTTDFAKFVKLFLTEYLPIERNYSVNTIRSYRDSFILLIEFIESNTRTKIEKFQIEKLDKKLVLEFVRWLEISRNCSTSTQNTRLAAIQSFFKYVADNNIEYLHHRQKIMSISPKKNASKSFEYLNLDGIRLLLEQVETHKASGRRNLALLCLMYDTGARVQEIIDLTPSVINFEEPHTIRLKGKGDKERIVPLLGAQIEHLKLYYNENKLALPHLNLTPLFHNSRKEKLTRAGINYIVKKYAKAARNINPSLIPEKISCHTFRHSKAMHLLQANVPLVYIRDILGHVSVTTTEIYAKVDSMYKRKALEQAYAEITETNDKPIWEGNSKLVEWLRAF